MSVCCIVPNREAIIDVVMMACPGLSTRSTGRILKVHEGFTQGLAGWSISRPRHRQALLCNGPMAAAIEWPNVLLAYKTDLCIDEVRRFADILGEFADMNFET